MKKSYNSSKRGFTLLEVLLATVILVIASTMIMKGFISVMVFARNNRNYSKSGQLNASIAVNDTLSQYATASNQMDTITALSNNGNKHAVSLNYDSTNYSGYVGAATLPTLYVDIQTFANPQTPVFNSASGNTLNYDGQDIDSSTVSNNRFAFFYDFGDYIGVYSGDHVYRWGYMFSQTMHDEFITPIYVDKNNNGLVGDDEPDTAQRARERIGYGAYGWYCFNASHVDGSGNPQSCRYTPYVPH